MAEKKMVFTRDLRLKLANFVGKGNLVTSVGLESRWGEAWPEVLWGRVGDPEKKLLDR